MNDRVSQYLLKNVIYNGKTYSKEDMVFRILLFKLFNKESTWELLEKELGEITLETFSRKSYSNVLEKAMQEGKKIYNDAYISCANKAYGYDRKHENHLALLEHIFQIDQAHLELLNAKTMEEAFLILKRYPLIGNFMAYQLVLILIIVISYPGRRMNLLSQVQDLFGELKSALLKEMVYRVKILSGICIFIKKKNFTD